MFLIQQAGRRRGMLLLPRSQALLSNHNRHGCFQVPYRCPSTRYSNPLRWLVALINKRPMAIKHHKAGCMYYRCHHYYCYYQLLLLPSPLPRLVLPTTRHVLLPSDKKARTTANISLYHHRSSHCCCPAAQYTLYSPS